MLEKLKSLEEGVARLLGELESLRKEHDELRARVKLLGEQAEAERGRVQARDRELQSLSEALLRLRSEREEMRERVERVLALLPGDAE